VQAGKFAEICKVICADPTVDLATVQGLLPIDPDDPFNPAPLRGLLASTDKPVLAFGRIAQNVSDVSRRFQAETGVPFIQGLPETVRALQGLVHYAAAVRRGVSALEEPSGPGQGVDSEAFAHLLADNGLPPPRSGLAKDPDDAAAIADRIGFPVAVKIVSPNASHKTEVGGVSLHLADAAAVREAASRMASRLTADNPRAALEGFLVQEMVEGLEMIVGVREDPQFGPFMIVGLGGVFVEVLRDVAIRLLPVHEETAREMLGSLRSARLFGPFRGRAPRDTEAVVRAMVGLSRVFMQHRNWLSDVEINPLIVLAEGEGVRAVDVRTAEQRESR
jgi:hypothetical protein